MGRFVEGLEATSEFSLLDGPLGSKTTESNRSDDGAVGPDGQSSSPSRGREGIEVESSRVESGRGRSGSLVEG